MIADAINDKYQLYFLSDFDHGLGGWSQFFTDSKHAPVWILHYNSPGAKSEMSVFKVQSTSRVYMWHTGLLGYLRVDEQLSAVSQAQEWAKGH